MNPPTPQYIFRGHQTTINTLCYFDNDQYIASGDADGFVIVWKMKTRRPVLQWKAHEESCLCLKVYKDQLVSQGRDDKIQVWQLPDLEISVDTKPLLLFHIPYDSLNFCKFSLCILAGSVLLAFPSNGDTPLVDIYDLSLKKWLIRTIGLGTLALKKGLCMAVELVEREEKIWLVVGYEDGSVSMWFCDVLQRVATLVWDVQKHKQPVLSMAIDQTNTWVVSTSADNQIIKYAIQSGDVLHQITLKKSGIAAVAVRPDNKIIATAGHDGRIRVFSCSSLRPLAILTYHRESAYCVAFGTQSGSNWLICGGKDARISLWSVY
ncbi:WD40-repeat-containing domain protein [Phycomyces nitens]|nr:WD40-repeat-containing domain protein [Phycomyces nitens]